MTGDTVTEDSFVAIASCPVRQRAIVTNWKWDFFPAGFFFFRAVEMNVRESR